MCELALIDESMSSIGSTATPPTFVAFGGLIPGSIVMIRPVRLFTNMVDDVCCDRNQEFNLFRLQLS